MHRSCSRFRSLLERARRPIPIAAQQCLPAAPDLGRPRRDGRTIASCTRPSAALPRIEDARLSVPVMLLLLCLSRLFVFMYRDDSSSQPTVSRVSTLVLQWCAVLASLPTTGGASGRGEAKWGGAAVAMALPRWLTRGKELHCLPRELRRVAHVTNLLLCAVFVFLVLCFFVFSHNKASGQKVAPTLRILLLQQLVDNKTQGARRIAGLCCVAVRRAGFDAAGGTAALL